MTPLETFVAAAHREPDLAEELDCTDEVVEVEVGEGTPSPAQRRRLLRVHVRLGFLTIGEFCRVWPFATVSIKFVASTPWKFGTRWIEKTQSEYHISPVMGHVTTRAHAGRT